MRGQVLSVVLAIALVGCVTTEQGPTIAKGQVVEGFINYGSYKVPLPEAKWTVINEDRFLNNLNAVLGELTLAEFNGSEDVSRMISIRTVLVRGGNSSGWFASKDCERKDMHYIQKRSNYSTALSCDYVNHMTPAAASSGSSVDKVLRELRERGVKIPTNAVYANYSRANQMNFLIVNVFFNPEVEGIPPSLDGAWATTEWNPKYIDRNPARKAYVEKIVAWSKEWAPRVDAAFQH